jgi:tryptophanyl-tRNA synthetase
LKKIALSGIKPTGALHIGNYLGMIKPALDLAQDYRALYFIADYHALTTVRDKNTLNAHVYGVAASLLALGLDTERITFFRQADVPEIFELTWILSCFTPKGLLNRAHAYKAAVDANVEAGKQPDADINAGLYNYPTLMAADILLYGSHVVPVGQDQRQHVEIARDIAAAMNHNYGKIFILPEAVIQEEVMTIPGLDGRKMSKNYNNTIPLFDTPKRIRQQVMKIVTDSKRPEDVKTPDSCNVFAIYKYFAAPEAIAAAKARYLKGGLAYSEIKQELFEVLDAKFGGHYAKYLDLINDHARLDAILAEGAARARTMAMAVMEKVRRKIGIK